MRRCEAGPIRSVLTTGGGSGRRFRVRRLGVVLLLAVALLVLGGCVADPPPLMGTAVSGNHQATVSWQAPLGIPFPITAYEVTPWIGQVPQNPIRFNSTATTQTVTGLTNGATYTFTVVAINTLGSDSASSDSSNPVTPSAETAAVAAGAGHTCAIVAGGAVDCWGYNGYGQLGDGTTTDSSTPVAVTGLTGATAITAGYGHTCAIVAGGASVDCWGYNANAQLGDGTNTDSSTPVAVTWP
jgi:hypothetical protein